MKEQQQDFNQNVLPIEKLEWKFISLDEKRRIYYNEINKDKFQYAFAKKISLSNGSYWIEI